MYSLRKKINFTNVEIVTYCMFKKSCLIFLLYSKYKSDKTSWAFFEATNKNATYNFKRKDYFYIPLKAFYKQSKTKFVVKQQRLLS